MNKFAKGAIATGVGVILLVGGGGTLATWNQDAKATMGTVVAGNLNMVAGTGVWTNAAEPTKEITDISKYHVVPGDTLTYTQPLTVSLQGNLMAANLTVTNAADKDFTFGTGAKVKTTLKNASNVVTDSTELVPAVDDKDFEVTATTTFTFDVDTSKRDLVGATADLSGIGYTLDQKAPANSSGL